VPEKAVDKVAERKVSEKKAASDHAEAETIVNKVTGQVVDKKTGKVVSKAQQQEKDDTADPADASAERETK